MPAPLLSDVELDALPRRRPRWVCHVVALTAAALVLLLQPATLELGWTDRFESAPRFLPDTAHLALRLLPVLVLVALARPVGLYRWQVLVAGMLIPLASVGIAWVAGFRMASLPYRDWRPRKDEFARVRRLPDSTYHVVVERHSDT